MARSGSISVVARTRGATRYCTGLTPIVVMASICSVTRMLPSSLAIVLPALAVTTTAASTGASSRARASATTPPTIPSAENCRKPTMMLTVNAIPVKRPTSTTMNVDPEPTKSTAMSNCPGRTGGRKVHDVTRTASITVSPRSSKNATKGRASPSNPRASAETGRCGASSLVSLTGAESSRPRSGLPIEPRQATRNAREDLPRDRVGMGRDLVGAERLAADGPVLRSQHDHLVVESHGLDVGHVDHGHVHGHRADDRGTRSVNEQVTAIAELTPEAVGVSHRHGRDARAATGSPGGA